MFSSTVLAKTLLIALYAAMGVGGAFTLTAPRPRPLAAGSHGGLHPGGPPLAPHAPQANAGE